MKSGKEISRTASTAGSTAPLAEPVTPFAMPYTPPFAGLQTWALWLALVGLGGLLATAQTAFNGRLTQLPRPVIESESTKSLQRTLSKFRVKITNFYLEKRRLPDKQDGKELLAGGESTMELASPTGPGILRISIPREGGQHLVYLIAKEDSTALNGISFNCVHDDRALSALGGLAGDPAICRYEPGLDMRELERPKATAVKTVTVREPFVKEPASSVHLFFPTGASGKHDARVDLTIDPTDTRFGQSLLKQQKWGLRRSLKHAISLARPLPGKVTSVVEVVGYADVTGTAESNQRLSLARAESVRTLLIEHGASAATISVRGAGAETAQPECLKCSRRVEVRVWR